MAYTLTNLETDIRNYTEVDSTVFTSIILNPIIVNDENKKRLNDIDEIDIYKQFIEEYFRKDTNTTLCINEVFLIFKGFLRQCGINIKKYNHRVFEKNRII